MTHALLFDWDLEALSTSLRISTDDVVAYFSDGRRVSFILERRIRDSFPGWKLAPSEGAGYDLIDENGSCWEVRSISKHIYFCPSYMVGSGRSFSEPGFLFKLNAIGGYICSDITTFPRVAAFMIPSNLIGRLYNEGKLGPTTSISRKRFYAIVVPELNALKS